MAQVDSLGEAEREASEALRIQLSGHSKVSERAFNTVGLCLGAAPEVAFSEASLSRRVATVLLIRLSDDLRGVALLGLRGYALQAASLVATMYEVAHSVAYIGSDEARASTWVEHADPTKPFHDVFSLTRDVVRSLGLNDPDAATARAYRVYRQLCLAKHSNPLLQKDHGHYVEAEAVVAMNGPNTSDDAIRIAKFALEHATRLTLIALTSFANSHVPANRRTTLGERIQAMNLETGDLAQAAIKQYGNEDPFRGEW